ncbi:hypothetical protein TNCV_1587381 [Trichonephila clavipes]|uniref:Uncharacterized protein n=1 Tax=Trichonephila clavipes TaxID=2585209 RepID=A0A8X6RF89_TRICX|nr:hypothetical protein TNCV_1587381 [Trichonephila clavipes]
MAMPNSLFAPTTLGHEDNLGVRPKRPSVGEVWKLGNTAARLGVILVTALECDVSHSPDNLQQQNNH